jgi:UDP-N-acetylglucosamine 1-carboxyvinyltransferase
VDKIVIKGEVPLYGSIRISGAKNAALPLMAAALLTRDTVTLTNIPCLADVTTLQHVLEHLGVKIEVIKNNEHDPLSRRTMRLNAEKITSHVAPYEMVRKMRASILVLGPLLARCGVAEVSLPGGCAIGLRPIDLHLKAFESLGAEVLLKSGYIEARVKDLLKGNEIWFEAVSVGATENAMMAATLAEGTTVLRNAAREPEIYDLAVLLNKMGAQISGHGTSTITIKGVSKLHGATHDIIPDRLETATYAVAAVITGGELTLEDTHYESFAFVADKLRQIGGKLEKNGTNSVVVKGNGRCWKPIDIETAPYPHFPTDLQAQFMTLLSLAPGTSVITENMFENRYMHVMELNRMGADIHVKGKCAQINGVERFYGAEVMATDLRASVSLVLAGLAAKGETVINRVYHLDRGYEKLERKLSQCGAKIERVVDRMKVG